MSTKLRIMALITLAAMLFSTAAFASDATQGASKVTKGYNIRYKDANTGDESDYIDPDTTFGLLRDSHVKTIRIMGYWNVIEKEAGKYDWTTVREAMNAAEDYDIDVLYVLGYYNTKLYPDTKTVTMGTDAEIEGFVNYAKACLTKFPQIKMVEIWNEPNGNSWWFGGISTENYKKMVKEVSAAIREMRPDIEIIIGSTSNSEDYTSTGDGDYMCMDWREFINAITTNDMTEYYDGISFHPYNNGKGKSADLDSARKNNGTGRKVYEEALKLIRQSGGFKKLYITETGGYSSENGKSEAQKGYEMVKQFVVCDEFGIDGTWIYHFVNKSDSEDENENNYGVITAAPNVIPLDGYYSVQQYLSLANSSKYIGKLNLESGISSHLYIHNDEPVVIMWSSSVDNGAYATLTYSAPCGVSVYDVKGKLISESAESISVGEAPVYIYGMPLDMINKASVNLANERIGYLNEQYSGLNMALVTEPLKAQDVYDSIDAIYAKAEEFIKKGTLSLQAAGGVADGVNDIASVLINSLADMDGAEKFSYQDLQKAYVNYEMTLGTLSYDDYKYAAGIKTLGMEYLDEVSNRVKSHICLPQGGENDAYVLNRYGDIDIEGEDTPGSLVTVKVTDPSGNIAYINTVKTDYTGKYRINCKINREYGDYNVYIKESTADTPRSITVPYIEDEYFSSEERILYAKVKQSEWLLTLSRVHMFTYSDMPEDKKLLVDVYWKPGEKQADALYSIKNIGNTFVGQIAICGYNDSNELINISIVDNLTIEKDKYIEKTLNFNYSERPYKLKAFAWKDMTPLSVVYEY